MAVSGRSDLLVLRIELQASSTDAKVDCVLERGGDDAAGGGERLDVWTASCEEMGLPLRLDRRVERSHGYEFRLPPEVIQALAGWVAGEPPGRPLWIRLVRPSGYLGAVPWERLLQPALGVPVLRLPEVEAGPPRETPGTLDVLLCASAPAAKESFSLVDHLDRIVQRLLADVPRRTVIHVFTDAEFEGPLRGRLAGRSQVRLYESAAAASYAVPEATERVAERPGRIENPWLLWMRDALAGRSIDLAHFLCHGYFALDRGALCFSESPVQNQDRRMSRFVGAAELTAFLTQIGAWAVGFSSPEHNYSEVGLRLLFDAVTQVRTGPVLAHDLPRDLGLSALSDAYRFLFGPPRGKPPSSPAIACCCQTSRVATIPKGDFVAEASAPFSSPAPPLSAATSDAISSVYSQTENVPAWVAAAQRFVEQRGANLRHGETGERPTRGRAHGAVEETLRQIQDIVAKAAVERTGGGS